MTIGRGPTALAVLMSLAVVLVPAAGAVGAVDLARELTVDGSAGREWGPALLRLACLGSAATLVWATLAAAAGVRDGWRRARSRAGVGPAYGAARPGGGTGPGCRADGGPGRAPAGGAGGLVSATVAALVVAALVAPSAAASSGTSASVAEPPTAQEQHGVTEQDPQRGEAPVLLAHGASSHDAATAPGSEGPLGSWAALAQTHPGEEGGFRAPRTIDPTTASLVTGNPTRSRPAPREVVVTAGDSLWSIAATALGPGSDDADVALAWPRWWQANRDVIGDDPHLLLPGQRLVEPAR